MDQNSSEFAQSLLKENSNLRLEDLQCSGLKILQDKTLYAFTSDSVILANFVKTRPQDFAVEIGAGSGVVSILVNAKNLPKKILAFEIQKEMANLATNNIKINNLESKIEIVYDDVKNFEKHFEKGSVDVVFSNPPYHKKTDFPQSEICKIAKEEVKLSMAELVDVASTMLKNGGSFFCCHLAERAVELTTLCENKGLAVKEMFFTENGKGQTKLVVIKCVKGGKNGVKVFPNLITNEECGNYIETLHTRHFLKK